MTKRIQKGLQTLLKRESATIGKKYKKKIKRKLIEEYYSSLFQSHVETPYSLSLEKKMLPIIYRGVSQSMLILESIFISLLQFQTYNRRILWFKH